MPLVFLFLIVKYFYLRRSWRPHEEYFHQRTRVVIQQYMTIGDNACDVTFVYPRVAQKSYGNEKR